MTSFCLYGLGVTGESVINYFDRTNLSITYSAWDDDISKRDILGYHAAEKEGKWIRWIDGEVCVGIISFICAYINVRFKF